jgi:hypothetical protein
MLHRVQPSWNHEIFAYFYMHGSPREADEQQAPALLFLSDFERPEMVDARPFEHSSSLTQTIPMQVRLRKLDGQGFLLSA